MDRGSVDTCLIYEEEGKVIELEVVEEKDLEEEEEEEG